MFFPVIGAALLGWIALSVDYSVFRRQPIHWGPKLSASVLYLLLASIFWRVGEGLSSDIAREAFKALYTWTGSPPPSMVIAVLFPLVILVVKRYRHGRLAMWKYWQRDLKDTAIAAVITWTLVYSYHLYRAVLGRQVTIASPRLAPPVGWDRLPHKPKTESPLLFPPVRTWVSVDATFALGHIPPFQAGDSPAINLLFYKFRGGSSAKHIQLVSGSRNYSCAY